jgi:hypothetical protein
MAVRTTVYTRGQLDGMSELNNGGCDELKYFEKNELSILALS